MSATDYSPKYPRLLGHIRLKSLPWDSCGEKFGSADGGCEGHRALGCQCGFKKVLFVFHFYAEGTGFLKVCSREMEYTESASVTFFYSSQVRTPKMHFIACIILETYKIFFVNSKQTRLIHIIT